MFDVVSIFLAKVARRLAGIARSTKSGLRAKDLHGDVWIAASEIGFKRGRPIDFEDPADQEIVLSRVYGQARKQRDWRLHFAHGLDVDSAVSTRLSERLGEFISMDPVAVFDRHALMMDQAAQLKQSHSQAAAYVIALRNFGDDRLRLSLHLAISIGALRTRMNKALLIVTRQYSILDGHDMISEDFVPLKRQALSTRIVVEKFADQVEMIF